MSLLFEEIKVGDRFRVSGGLETMLKIQKEVIDGRLITAEYLSGPYKNEFVEILGATCVKRVKAPIQKFDYANFSPK